MAKTNNKMTPESLEKMLGSKERVLFFVAWLKNNRNATQAYKELHPKVKRKTARTLGSRMLANIDIQAVMSAYGLNHEAYFEQLSDGLKAVRKRAEITERDDKGAPVYEYFDEPDHKTRRDYHKTLGKLLGVEQEEGPNVAVLVGQAVNQWVEGAK